MQINISQFAGFCDGVKRAYDMVMELDISAAPKPIFVLGSLVHNPEVVKKIEERGIQQITREQFFSAKLGEIGMLIITAHGDSPEIFKVAKEKNIAVFDVTCPKVIKAQRLAKVFSERGYQIVLFGDKEHKEVRGINDWGGGKALVVSNKEDAQELDFGPYSKLAILSQTTQNEDLYLEVANMIKERNSDKEVEIIVTTCQATHDRQEEARALASSNEVVLVIGSGTSANSVRLFEISKQINPKTYFIEKAEEIEARWFFGVQSVGVTAGASTPFWIIQDVITTLEKI